MYKFRGFYKIKCPCGYEGLSFMFGEKKGCPNCEDGFGNAEKYHKQIEILPTEKWKIDDIVNVWANEIEGANYHSSPSVPSKILEILRSYINDEELIRKILLKMHEENILEI